MRIAPIPLCLEKYKYFVGYHNSVIGKHPQCVDYAIWKNGLRGKFGCISYQI